MDTVLRPIKNIIPKRIFGKLQPYYHYTLAFLGAAFYRFPSRHIKVIGITGTKGKSTVAELVSAILEEAGHTTALQTTVRFKIGKASSRNLYKMTMPGRFFLQKFLRKAVTSGATYAVVEMTSEGAKQFRHTFIELDALIFTNLSPEHIESHGSYEAYRDAKLSIAEKLSRSKKPKRLLIINGDDREAPHFLKIQNAEKHVFHLKDAEPFTERDDGINFTWQRETVRSRLLGIFNLYNMLAAASWATHEGIENSLIKSALEKFRGVPGRLEEVTIEKDQPFKVFIDYAHTPESLKAVYETFKPRDQRHTHRLVCVLGNTGGGRDTWKRPEMGKIAEIYCDHVILTNEDPYDEEPRAIVAAMQKGMTERTPEIILDRKQAIHRAIEIAKQLSEESSFPTPLPKTVVLITGKGTDPYIMGPNGSKTPWDDKTVAEEALREHLFKK